MRIAGVMTVALKLDDVLKITLNSLVKDMEYDRAQVFLIDESLSRVTRHVSYDFLDKFTSQEDNPGKNSPADPVFSEIMPSFFSKKFSSDVICYTPMFWKGKRIGVLVVDNLFSRETLNTDDFSFLGILANQLGILIENSMLFEKIERSSITDGLTGLFNHRHFYNLLSEEIARADRSAGRLSLLICDLDHFKDFNDKYGHQAGDKVLKQVAGAIKRSVRSIDIAARYGGEEFAVILPSADTTHSALIAERINNNIKKAGLEVAGKLLKITVSVGIATYPDDSNEKTGLVRKADQALYWSKNHGRDMVSIYSEIK
jgi:diguanylate cyclase (GGDEF)-like protein